jgi:hypothetical protein
MEIARERFLDDGKRLHLTLALRSRTTEMHSVLTSLTAEQRNALAVTLARALDEITGIVTPRPADSSEAGPRASTHAPSR